MLREQRREVGDDRLRNHEAAAVLERARDVRDQLDPALVSGRADRRAIRRFRPQLGRVDEPSRKGVDARTGVNQKESLRTADRQRHNGLTMPFTASAASYRRGIGGPAASTSGTQADASTTIATINRASGVTIPRQWGGSPRLWFAKKPVARRRRHERRLGSIDKTKGVLGRVSFARVLSSEPVLLSAATPNRIRM